MRILIIDNYDSFVHNIVGLLRELRDRRGFNGLEWERVYNDRVEMEAVGEYDALILSPGPGIPKEAGAMPELLHRHASRLPVLGVCLGFQAIAERFGAELRQLPIPRHGHPTRLCHMDPEDPLVGSLANHTPPPTVGRYHSWVVDSNTLPPELTATSFDEEGNIMSFRHRNLPVFGTQFHPESIITDCGGEILANFLLQAIRTNASKHNP